MTRAQAFAPFRQLVACTALLLAVSGCQQELHSEYGGNSGAGYADSINGTAVLSQLFKQRGHRVRTITYLSPQIGETAETIVWFPDDFGSPDGTVLDWFYDWLLADDAHTLIIVGRDFDCLPRYLEETQPPPQAEAAPAESPTPAKRTPSYLLPGAERAVASVSDYFWVQFEPGEPRIVRSLDGPLGWVEGVDARKLEMDLRQRMIPNLEYESLLESSGDLLVARCDRQVLAVVNGSFLLNMQLVNHEHRKLAARLIGEVGEPGQTCFLESGPGGPPVHEEEPTPPMQTGWEVFGMQPIGTVLLLFALAGIVFCFSRWAIFGLPRPDTTPPVGDFGEHIAALGRLLARRGDEAFARERLAQYQQPQRREQPGLPPR